MRDMTSQPDGRRSEILLLAALLIISLAARLVPGERMVDDAHITFRYARNLVEGSGFVYNPGERVLGTTTPVYTLLLAGLALVTGIRDFPALALAINALTGAVSVGLLYLLGRRFTGHRAPALAAALLWAVAPYSVTFAVGGMETDLAVALLLGAAHAHLAGRPRAMAAASALAVLTRPDTVILVGLLWLDLFLARLTRRPWDWRKLPWVELLIGLLVLAPWLVFGTLYFGSPVPGSIAAKSVTYRLPPEDGLIRLIQHYSTPFFDDAFLGSLWRLIGFAVYLALCAVGGVRAVRRNRRAWPVLAYPYLYLAVFAAANPLLFRWYLSPPLPFYFLLIVTGVWTVASDVTRLAARSSKIDVGSLILDPGSSPVDRASSIQHPAPSTQRLATLLLLLFTIAALASTLNAWELHPDHGPDRPAPKMAWFKLEQLYAWAANVVLSSAAPGDTLCAGDIGVLGYRTDLRILDTVGLVTPESRCYYPADPDLYVINYAIPADLVLSLDPDYIVILEVYGRRGLLPDPRFQARYVLLDRFETDIYGSNGMLVFERR
jgi:hypothetical protein